MTFDTPNPLGLKLDTSLRVLGFHRDPSGGKMPAEASGWLRNGDILSSVNGVRVEGFTLHSVTLLVAKAEVPKRLTFISATGNREEEMAGVYDGPSGIHGHEGSVDLATLAGGLGLGSVPFLQAMFGGQTSCTAAPLVFADPSHGCAAYKNANAAFGSIVVVERGLCTFSDKAAIAQGNSAVGLIVLNDGDGEYVRMPIDPKEEERLYLTLPVVMVDAGSGANTLRVMLTGSSERVGGGGGVTAGALKAATRGSSQFGSSKEGGVSKVLGGVQARLARRGQSCKPYKKKSDEKVGEKKSKKEKGAGIQDTETSGFTLGDPLASGGELLLFPPGTPLGGGGHPSTLPLKPPSQLRGKQDNPARQAQPQHRHRHSEGYYREGEGGFSEDSALMQGAGSRAARDLAAAAAESAAKWDEEARETEGSEGGELASQEDVQAAALLERARRGSSLRLEYVRATFGGPLPQGRIAIVAAIPADACAPLAGPPGGYKGAAVLVVRGLCGFSIKASYVAAAGGLAMVAINNDVGLFPMGGEGSSGAPSSSTDLNGSGGVGAVLPVPSVMVSMSGGTSLRAALLDSTQPFGMDKVVDSQPLAQQSGHLHGGIIPASGAHPESQKGPSLTFIGNADSFPAWEELNGLASPSSWSEDAVARKKTYQRLARLHHPDKSTGSQERFTLLAFLYKRANAHYDPGSEPNFVNEL